jgi:uncharacterized repeat protein (TIGR03803 family)
MQRSSLLGAVVMLAVFSMPLLLAVQPAQAQEIVLYSFCVEGPCVYGEDPYSSLTPDNAGNFYGTAYSGGDNYYAVGGDGNLYELSPNGAGGYSQNVLYNFCSLPNCTDGANPAYSNLIFDSMGNLYGTTLGGGAYGYGTVFELGPEPEGGCLSGSGVGNGWCETVLHSFDPNGGDGYNPYTGVIWDTSGNGNLYGTTEMGGSENSGTVYEMSPNPNGGWNEQVIYNADISYSTLAMDSSRNIYGVDAQSNVFELSPNSSGGWNATNIYTFCVKKDDGCKPYQGPVLDSAGNLYGTTLNGGTKSYGTVWKMSPGKKKGTWTEKVLHSFSWGKDGAYPVASLVLDSSGNIYGTTTVGGADDYGTVFELAVSGTTYKEKILWSFNETDGYYPIASLLLDDGDLYGTTELGGASVGASNCNCGAAFELSLSSTATTTTLSSSPNPSTSGETVTFTAVVTPAPPDGENVNFMEGSTLLGTDPLSAGSATFMTSTLPVGTSKIDAVYGGDLNFSTSTSNTVKQVVKK